MGSSTFTGQDGCRKISPRSISLKISVIYVLSGALWILLSDLMLGYFVTDAGLLTQLAIYKGIFYVLSTGWILYLLIRRGISKIQETEHDRSVTEERYRELINASPDIICFKDGQGRWLEANEADLELFELKGVDFAGKKDSELAHFSTFYRETFLACEDTDELTWRNGKLTRGVEVIPRPDGSNKVYDIIKVPLFHADGARKGLIVLGRDITELRRAEEELWARDEQYRLIFENMPDVLYRTDAEGNLVFVSPSIEGMFGYKPVEALGMNLAESFFVDASRKTDLLAILGEQGEVHGFEAVVRHRNGSHIWLSSNCRFYKDAQGNVLGVEGIVRDITDSKLTEVRLQESNAYLENILDNSPDPIGIVDEHGRFIRLNRVAVALFGFSVEEVGTKKAFDLYADADERDRLLSRLRRNGIVRARQVILRRKDGTTFPAELSLSLLRNSAGRSIGSVAIARDMSEIRKANEMLREEIAQRKKAEEALKESESMYRTIFENTGTATIIIEEDTTIALANAECEKLSGYLREEVEGRKSWGDFVRMMDLQRLRDYHRLRRIDSNAVPQKYEFILVDREGREKNVISTVAVIPGTGRTVASLLDITERKELEEQLFKADKLESIGILAGGIAHDFNNILAGILGNISLARINLKDEEKVLARLLEAEKATLRAKDLTYQLLTFSKGGEPVKKTTSILEIVKDSSEFSLRGSNVGCRLEADEVLWPTKVDTGQVSQVVNNLIINAKQAMPMGGLIDISITNENVLPTSELRYSPGRYVRISIRDQGTGIPKEHLTKIFDPYFTTKQAGNGLGLATAYSIIHKHQGYIDVESILGMGTTFHVYMPATETSPPVAHALETEPVAGRGRILLMDDEEAVRDVVNEMLGYLGYQVVLTDDGAQALRSYEEAKASGEPFDAVILDLTVPGGMGGLETLRKLMEMDPSVTAIASSGYSNDPVMANCSEFGFQGVIAKPYRIEDLGRVLQEATGTFHHTA